MSNADLMTEINKRISDSIKSATKSWIDAAREEAKRTRALAPLAEKLVPASNWVNWFISGKLFLKVSGSTKTDFSAAVKAVSDALGSPPDISVQPSEYIAEFEGGKVHVYLSGAQDCRLIEEEVTVTKKVVRPHPECKAALSALEEIAQQVEYDHWAEESRRVID